MIILDDKCLGLELLLKDMFNNPKSYAHGGEFVFTDFDDTIITVSITESLEFAVQLRWKAVKVFTENGAKEVIEKVFEGSKVEFTDDSVTVMSSAAAFPADEKERGAFFLKFALLKRHLFSGPFLQIMNKDTPADKLKPVQIEMKYGEFLWIIPKSDRSFICGYSHKVADSTDLPMAKVLYKEFDDARRDRELSACPVPMSSVELPKDLDVFSFNKKEVDGFITITVQPRHYQTAGVRDKVIGQLLMFRPYLNYHFKCTKAFLHYRMRTCHDSLVQVLNRAKGEVKLQRGTKTFSGKNVVQKK